MKFWMCNELIYLDKRRWWLFSKFTRSWIICWSYMKNVETTRSGKIWKKVPFGQFRHQEFDLRFELFTAIKPVYLEIDHFGLFHGTCKNHRQSWKLRQKHNLKIHITGNEKVYPGVRIWLIELTVSDSSGIKTKKPKLPQIALRLPQRICTILRPRYNRRIPQPPDKEHDVRLLQDRERVIRYWGEHDNWQEPGEGAFDWELLYFADRGHIIEVHWPGAQLDQGHDCDGL